MHGKDKVTTTFGEKEMETLLTRERSQCVHVTGIDTYNAAHYTASNHIPQTTD